VGIPWRSTDSKDDYFVKLLTVVRDNPDKKIFLHCEVGIDRTDMMIASDRMAERGWTAEEALREMQGYSFSSFHQAVLRARLLGTKVPGSGSLSPAFLKLRFAEQKLLPQPRPKQ
jgi:hypothetical protein